jgi:hypothetical protein
MILIVLAIGIILLVSALRGTYGNLFAALGQDIPHFVVWAAAIVALGAIGFIPGLKPISRGLLALVLVVLVFNNYKNILSGFQTVVQPPNGTSGNAGTSNDQIRVVAKPYVQPLYETPPSAYSTGTMSGPNG